MTPGELAVLLREKIASLFDPDEVPAQDRHEIRKRAPQEPHRICAPPGFPDAPPFSYREGEPGSDAQPDHAQAQAVEDHRDA